MAGMTNLTISRRWLRWQLTSSRIGRLASGVAPSVSGKARTSGRRRKVTFLYMVALVAVGLFAACAFAQGGKAAARDPYGADKVYPLRDGFVDAHGVMIYYVSLGRGTPLVIVHGGPGASHDYFLPYLLPLARHHRLIFIDERGSGRSQKLDDPSGYTVENMVEDVEAVRMSLGSRQDFPAGTFLWRSAGAGLCAEVSEEPDAS